MTRRIPACALVLTAVLAWPTPGYAQEATIAGTVTDATGAVLPGVTVTAVHETIGNTFLAVSDEQGRFRIPVRVGAYRIAGDCRDSRRSRAAA